MRRSPALITSRGFVTVIETIVTNAIDEPIPTGQRDPPAAAGWARARDSHLLGAGRSDPRRSAAAHGPSGRMGDRQDDAADALRQQAGDAVVLSMAYPQSADEFLAGLVAAIDAELATDWPRRLDVELGLDIGIADARIRRPSRDPERELRAALRRLVERHGHEGRSVLVLLDDVDLLPTTGDVLLRLRACALELYAADLPFAFLVAALSGLFDAVRSAHEPLVRFFEPLSLGPLDSGDATRAMHLVVAGCAIRSLRKVSSGVKPRWTGCSR